MVFKSRAAGLTWTDLELEGLLEDEDSCIHYERAHKHLGLHPYHLTDLNAALKEIFYKKLYFYDSELDGLALAYRNPKLLSSMGDTLYDSCYIHIDVEADFYIFKPEIGKSMKGFVEKVGHNHVSLLVHKYFNISIPRPIDYSAEEPEPWIGDKLRIGEEVRFTPVEINYERSKLPYIKGFLDESDYQRGCRIFDEEIEESVESEFQKATRRSFNEDGPKYSQNIKFKSENKKTIFNSDLSSDDSDDNNSKIDIITKKKKRKGTPVLDEETAPPPESKIQKVERKSFSENELKCNKKIKLQNQNKTNNSDLMLDNHVQNGSEKDVVMKKKKRKNAPTVNEEIGSPSESEFEKVKKNSYSEDDTKHSRKIKLKNENKNSDLSMNDESANDSEKNVITKQKKMKKPPILDKEVDTSFESEIHNASRKSFSEDEPKCHKNLKLEKEDKNGDLSTDDNLEKDPKKDVITKKRKIKKPPMIDKEVAASFASEFQKVSKQSFSEDEPKYNQKIKLKKEKKNDDLSLDNGFDKYSERDALVNKRKRKSTPVSEYESDSSVIRNKEHKKKLKETFGLQSEAKHDSEPSPTKKRKRETSPMCGFESDSSTIRNKEYKKKLKEELCLK